MTILRRYGDADTKIGMAPTGNVWLPETDSEEKVESARKRSFSIDPNSYLFGNAWWMDPVYLGRFPEGAEETFATNLPTFTAEEWSEISQSMDFCGFKAL